MVVRSEVGRLLESQQPLVAISVWVDQADDDFAPHRLSTVRALNRLDAPGCLGLGVSQPHGALH